MKKRESCLKGGRRCLRGLQLTQDGFGEGRDLTSKKGVRRFFNFHPHVTFTFPSREFAVIDLRSTTVHSRLAEQGAIRSPDFDSDSFFSVSESGDEGWRYFLVEGAEQLWPGRNYCSKEFRSRTTNLVGGIFIIGVSEQIVR